MAASDLPAVWRSHSTLKVTMPRPRGQVANFLSLGVLGSSMSSPRHLHLPKVRGSTEERYVASAQTQSWLQTPFVQKIDRTYAPSFKHGLLSNGQDGQRSSSPADGSALVRHFCSEQGKHNLP